MADIEFSHGMGAYGREPAPDQDDTDPSAWVMMTNVAGAVVSLALIAGIGVWGYELMARDVSGIPVVRAAEGEMRVRPAEPGGQLARHQGLAVNAVAAEGSAAGPVDQVTLAPRDTDLAEEDQPIGAETVSPVVQPEPLAPAAESLPAAGSDPRAPIETAEGPKRIPARTGPSGTETPQASAIDAVVAELTAGTTPFSDEDDSTASDEATAPVTAQAVKRPQLRPRSIARLQPAAFVPDSTTAEVEAAAIPSGTRLVQLGAFDSAEVARSEWVRLEARFGEYMQDKSRVVQRAESGGRTFYRLRAMGFLDLADTRRFCSAFKAEGVDCIPVAAK